MIGMTRIKLNPIKTTTNPPPLRLTLADYSFRYRPIEVLNAGKQLKDSLKYNKVFIKKT